MNFRQMLYKYHHAFDFSNAVDPGSKGKLFPDYICPHGYVEPSKGGPLPHYLENPYNTRKDEPSVWCVYRIGFSSKFYEKLKVGSQEHNEEHEITGVCWSAPALDGKSRHAEDNLFSQLFEAVQASNAKDRPYIWKFKQVDMVIKFSPCYDKCWQSIKGISNKRPDIQFNVYYIDEYSMNLMPYRDGKRMVLDRPLDWQRYYDHKRKRVELAKKAEHCDAHKIRDELVEHNKKRDGATILTLTQIDPFNLNF